MTIVIGENVVNKDSFSNLKIIYEYGKEKNAQEIVDSIDKEQLLLALLFSIDNVYSKIYPHTGEGITTEVKNT